MLPARRPAVEAAGARWAPTVREAVGGAQVVFTALPGSPELLELVVGSDGLLPHLPPGSCWVDLTSASPEVSRRCSAHASRLGVAHLDAPLGGGVPAVVAGDVVLYVGGDADTLTEVTPVLRRFAATMHHVGGHGAGHLVKLLVNTLWFGQVGLVTEAVLLAGRHGIAGEHLRTLLLGSAGDSAFVRQHLPRLLAGDVMADFGLDRCVEELAAVETAAADAGVPHPVTSAVADLHRAALAHFGAVDGELLAGAWLRDQVSG